MSTFFRQFPKIPYVFSSVNVENSITNIFKYVTIDDRLTDDLATYRYYQIRNGERPDIVSTILYGTPDYYWTFFVINSHLKKGLAEWPLSELQFEDFMNDEYTGKVLEFYPWVGEDADGLPTVYNSIAGNYSEGDELEQELGAGANNPKGTVAEINIQMNQLILTDLSGFDFVPNVEVSTTSGTASIQNTPKKVYDHRDAPHHYENPEGDITFVNEHYDEDFSEFDGQQNKLNLEEISYYDYELALNEKRANIRIIKPELIREFATAFRELVNA